MPRIILVGLPLFLIVSSGCGVGTVAKTAIKVVRGVQADAIPIKDISQATLKEYSTLTVGEVTTDVGSICPPELITEVRRWVKERFAENLQDRFPGGGKNLLVDIVCRFFKKKSLIGKEGRLDLLVTLVDAESREELGKVYIEGISESPVHTGIDDMAKGVAKELAKYLDKRKKGDE